MRTALRIALAASGVAFATQAAAQITFYENESFQGRSFSAQKQVPNLGKTGFNDRASSAIVVRDRWEVCENAGFEGRCIVLRPGRYASLAAMGLNDRVSSLRIVNRNQRVEDSRYGPEPVQVYDARRRHNEQLYEADVASVRAVVGPTEQRCWVEREQVGQDHTQANVPAAIAGAVIGGILGHQVGSGRGNDLATAGGAVAGAAVGANVGRGSSQQSYGRDVQRCETVAVQGRPDYWDVTYNFRGRDHRMQMSTLPGRTVAVNDQGEPRT